MLYVFRLFTACFYCKFGLFIYIVFFQVDKMYGPQFNTIYNEIFKKKHIIQLNIFHALIKLKTIKKTLSL